MPSVAELIAALPEPIDASEDASPAPLNPLLEAWSHRPVPLGRFRRLRMLGTLQAQIAAAYGFYWLRGWFKGADESKRLLAETHWRTAMRILDSMSYLRGAAMKVGQTLANFPDIAPREFVETFEKLHYTAPPMHWSLLKEMAFNELNEEPENLFAAFDKRAFAAASLGQVHAARLKTGEEVAVKIQYPGIARTVREDIRNLLLCMLPGRLSRDWENTKEQFEDLGARLERETDYEQEAAALERARKLFYEDDGIMLPRVYQQYSTARVLTMERLPGLHLEEFLATNPPQEVCNEFARKITRFLYRMLYAGRTLYIDLHPGNFLFMEDGRLGVIDFGFVLELDDTLWELFRKMDRALTTGERDERLAAVKEWNWITDDPSDQDRLRLADEFADCLWRSRYCGGDFDFGDEADFRRAVDLFMQMGRKRYTLSRPCTPSISRHNFGWRSMFYRLKAKIDIAPIAEEEVRAAGWDRSDYARNSKNER
jgi:predicted unusual protein kinase regulating ubiquinone biosynthesis (AarF/ABC1/UbiB family)